MRSRGMIQWSLLCILLAASSLSGGEPVYYSIRMNDKPIGYARVVTEDVTWSGKQLRRLTSQTMLKIALLGKTRETTRRSETLLEPKSGRPVYYDLTDKTNEIESHIECRFSSKDVKTWSYRQGAPKGDPAVTSLPADIRILGSNDFGHWGVLAQAATREAVDGIAELTVFLPDNKATESFRLVKGASQELDVVDGPRACIEWQLQGAGIAVFTDAQSGQFVCMDIPAQKTKILLADQSDVQKTEDAGAQEILARHFAQSNTGFDDSLKVRMLKAEIDVTVIGSGVTNEDSVLTTAMQKFDGHKEAATIQGVVTVRTKPFKGGNAVPFPASPTPEMKAWVDPSDMIECDDPTIIAQAKKLAADAQDRWQAVLQVAEWVHKEIAYEIADAPSARLALEKRKGDCGPHATLTVAMLRAVNVPARLVGGLVYTPMLGGSFGQHAWVEVNMGVDGWIALDPTTGEHEQMSATHIKLFEGMGGVIPKQVQVVAFEPKNRDFVPVAQDAKPLGWKLGAEYQYKYLAGPTELGVQKFTITETEIDGQPGHEVKSSLNIASAQIAFTTQMTVLANALPVKFYRDVAAPQGKTTIECRFTDGAVIEKISGTKNLEQEIKIQPGTYCFDNNLIPSFALICSQMTLKESERIDVRTFHPSTMQILPLTFEVKGMKTVTVDGKEIECFECFVTVIKNTFWVTRDGRLVRVEAGNLVIDVSPVD